MDQKDQKQQISPSPTRGPGPVSKNAGGAEVRESDWRRAAFALVAVGWTANHFTVLLDSYRRTQGLSSGLVNAAFVVYVLGIVPGILVGGPATGRLGRRRVVLGAVVVSGLSSLSLMAGAALTPFVFLGRLLSGLAIGAVMTAAVVWSRELYQLQPLTARAAADPDLPARRTSLCLSAGFAFSGLSSAVVAEWLPRPLVLAYLPQLVLAAAALYAIAGVPDTAPGGAVPPPGAHDRAGRPPPSSTAAVPHPDPPARLFLRYVVPLAPWVFLAPTLGYVTLPNHVGGALGRWGLLYSGLVVLVTPGTGLLATGVARRLAPLHPLAPARAGLSCVAAGLLGGAWAVRAVDPLTALAASALLGAGYGLCSVQGLLLTARLAPPGRLARYTAVFWALCYTGFTAPFLFDRLEHRFPAPALLLAVAGLAAVTLASFVGRGGARLGRTTAHPPR